MLSRSHGAGMLKRGVVGMDKHTLDGSDGRHEEGIGSPGQGDKQRTMLRRSKRSL